MSKKISYNKEKIWAGIENDQNKKRRKKILPYFIFLAIGVMVTATIVTLNLSDQAAPTTEIFHKAEQLSAKETKPAPITSSVQKNQHPITSKVTAYADSSSETNLESTKPNNTLTNNTAITKTKFPNIIPSSNNTSYNNSYNNSYNTSINTASQSAILNRTTTLTTTQQSTQSAQLPSRQVLASYLPLSTLTPKPLSQINRLVIPTLFPFFNSESLSKTKQRLSVSKLQLFSQNTFYRNGVKKGSTEQQEIWNTNQSHNFGTTSAIGLELQLSNQLLLRAGIELSIISTTYRHEVISVENNIIPNDTIDIYENFVGMGERLETITTTRSLVKNNELYRIGFPIALGYTINTDIVDIKFLVQSTFTYWQNFKGILNDLDNSPLFENEAQGDYFKHSWSSNFSGALLLNKKIAQRLDLNLGLSYAPARSNNTNTKELELRHSGLGWSAGLSYTLR